MTDSPTVTNTVTAFKVNAHGVTVTVTRTGEYWSFEWPGRNRDDKALVWCTYAEAERIAGSLAEQVADLKPLRDELERRREDIAVWLRSQEEER